MLCSIPLLLAFSTLVLPALTAVHLSKQQLLSRTSEISTPIVVPASQNFEGNDGPWSSFTLQIGTPAQNVNVLISTAGYQTWAVVPEGCTPSDPPSCAVLRGGKFLTNQSSTWTRNNVTTNGTFTLGLELNLDYSGNGLFGYDTIGLGWQGSNGPSLDQQIVAGIAAKEFYLGIFGLNPRPSNFTNFNHPVPSYMANLRERSMIPSLSWSYTAGNQYRLNKVLGSLVLGGYDASRFIPNDLSFAFNDQDIRDLTVSIQAISFSTSEVDTTLSSNRIAAFVDSTVPYFYLPLDICQKFESAFGIIWNNDVQAYLINDTQHQALEAQNASVTFTLSNSTVGRSVNISLPYAAFDLVANYPLVTNSSRYFPLMRAANESQYTLGRTFLQEAYLIADYERRNFSISQCAWNADMQQNIKTIISPIFQSQPHHMSAGVIVGIAIGSFTISLIVVSILYYVKAASLRAAKIQEKHRQVEDSDTGVAELEFCPQVIVQEIDGAQNFGQEIDGCEHYGHEISGDINFPKELDSKQYGARELPMREDHMIELPG